MTTARHRKAERDRKREYRQRVKSDVSVSPSENVVRITPNAQSDEEFVAVCRAVYRERILERLRVAKGIELVGIMKAFESAYGKVKQKPDKVQLMWELLPEDEENPQ